MNDYFYRQKQGSSVTDSVLVQVPNGLALEFERTDSTRRLRLVLYEILMIQSQVSLMNYLTKCPKFSISEPLNYKYFQMTYAYNFVLLG